MSGKQATCAGHKKQMKTSPTKKVLRFGTGKISAFESNFGSAVVISNMISAKQMETNK
jgi:hypothetical protein